MVLLIITTDEDMEITSEADLGVEVTPSLHKCPLTYHGKEHYMCTSILEAVISTNNHLLLCTVMKEFTKRTGHLLEKQDCLRELPAKIYERQVYGQDVFRQQALILNWNILCTFCRNLIRHSKVKPSYCGKILWSLARTQAAGYYIRESSQRTVQTFMRNSIFPLHEPVVGSYDNRKAALFKRWEAFKRPKCIMPPIYTPLVHSGDVVGFQKTTKDKVTFKSLPQKIASSRHFERVKDIVQSENYALNHDERDPTMQSNWLYYCVMFDPTVSPEAADQGYIGATNRDLVTRWKEHTGPKGKHDEMLIHYNLALVSQYARQRGEDISKYVAVFALGTTTDESALRATEGELIRESFRGGFGVTNMQYGMNSKQSSAKQQPRRKIPIHQKSRTLMKKTIGRLHGLPKHTLSKHTILWHRN